MIPHMIIMDEPLPKVLTPKEESLGTAFSVGSIPQEAKLQ